MSDDVFRQTPHKKTNTQEAGPQITHKMQKEFVAQDEESFVNPLERVHDMQAAMAAETGQEPEMPHPNLMNSPDSPIKMSGNMPEAFRKVMQQQAQYLHHRNQR